MEWIRLSRRVPTLSVLAMAMLLSTPLHATPGKPPVGERSLSKVCNAKVPAPIENETVDYLFAITTMRGDPKVLCGLWQDIKPKGGEPELVWRAIAGAVLLHTLSKQTTIAPYRSLLRNTIAINPKWKINSVEAAMEIFYVNVNDNIVMAGAGTTMDLANLLQGPAPDIAATLRKGFEKWDVPDDD